MKKSILIVCLVLCSIAHSYGQQLGLKAGGNLSKRWNEFVAYKYKSSYQVGVWYSMPLNGKLGLFGDVTYISQGYQYPTYEPASAYRAFSDLTEKVNYVTLTTLATYSPHSSVSIGIGPHLQYDASGNGKAALRTDRISFNTGVSMALFLWPQKRFSPEIRYQHGLTQILKRSLMVQNRSLQLTFNYRLSK